MDLNWEVSCEEYMEIHEIRMSTSDMATPETQFVAIQTMQQPSAVLAPPCLWVTKALAFEVRREQPEGNRWLCKGLSAVSLLPRGASISIEQCIKEALAKAHSPAGTEQ